jgi:uncharacterized RDD family membrane protein YckC
VRDGAGADERANSTIPSIRRRLVCMVYESLLLFSVALFASLPFIGAAGAGTDGWVRNAYQAYLFLVIGLYFVWSWRRRGQTLAMKTWKMRLVGLNGVRITFRQALLRYAFSWPSLLLGGIGILYALLDSEGQFLHDRLSGTRIVTTE